MMKNHFDGCCCLDCALDARALAGSSDEPGDGLGNTSAPMTRSFAAPVVKPVYTDAEVIYAMTTGDGTFSSVAWSFNQISFSIGTGQISQSDPNWEPEFAGYVAMTPFMEAQARAAFQLWADLVAVELIEVADNNSANIIFNYSSETNDLSYARYNYTFQNNQPRSSFTMVDADIWIDYDWAALDEDSDLTWWGAGITTYLHEIGHALGVSHPGQYNISANYQNDATHYQDTRQYTVMSYFDAEANGSGADHLSDDGLRSFGGTPLLHDILTVQAIYGANMTTRTGNTTYGFNSNAGREAFDFTINTRPVVAIWDAGGLDYIDVSGFAANQTIDLNAGAFSSVGGLSQNLAIAHGALIERAVLGAGNDVIIGNAVSNALWGGAGDDTIAAGGGDDGIFGGPGADQIDGGAGSDWLRFTNATSKVQVSLQAGIGTVGEAAGDTYVNIERVSGSAYDDVLQGDANANQIFGLGGNDILRGFGSADFILGDAGDDTLEGGTQNDVMRGGPGADRIDGGVGSDWAQYLTASAAVAADLVTGGTAGEALGDVFISVENLGGSIYNDTLTGSDDPNIFLGEAGHDRITGLGAADMLRGNAGSDTLDGGSGDDTLVGGPGPDRLDGGTGRDWADYQDAVGAVNVSLITNLGFGADAEGDILIGIEWLWGGAYNDTLEGDDGVNLLRGGAGADRITSHGGSDYIKGQGGADLFVFGPDDGLDRVFDFEIGVDTINFAPGTVSSFAELTVNDFNGNASVVYDIGDTVLLIGIAPGAVDESWFTFG